MKNFNLIEMAKAMKEHKLRHMWRYAAMIFAVLVMSMANIGTAWGTTYHLISGDAVNTTNFMASGGTYTKQSSGVTIGGTKFGHYVLGGTASSASGGYAVNKVIIYNCQTTNTSITIIAYNKNSSSNRSYSVTNIEEGFSGTLSVQHTETISNQDSTHKTLTYTNTTNRTIYIHVASNAGDMCFLDVEVNETGTALPKAGDAGYALNLNKGRLWAPSSAATTMPYEGLTFYPSSNYQCYGSSTSLAFTKKSTTTYFKFTNTSPCKLKVTFTNGLVYNTSQSHTGATALTSATATNDLSAGTYYIMADGSTNSNPAITKIEFLAAAASCDAAPTAPTGLAAGSITASGATFTITDGAGTNNYEIVCKTASGSPAADATPTATGTSTSITVSTLSAGTTYYAWVRAVCDATHKSSWVALSGSTFQTLATPTASFSNSTYAIGGSALDLSSLWTSNSDGAVTFSVDSAGTTGASVSTAAFSATTAGYAKVKAVQAANGSYDAITKYAYIQVGSTEMGSHTITYNLKVNVNSTELQHCPSVIPTSLYLAPSKTIGTNGSGGPLSSGQSAQTIETQKFYIDNSTSAYNSSNYVSYTFTVTDGYTFEPTSVTVKFQSVSGLCNFHYELTDGVNTISKDFAATTSTGGTPEHAVWSGSGTTLSGTVTLKVFAYKQADAATAYRFGTPITITGTVAEEASCSAPTAVYVTQTAGSSDMVAGESFTLSAATSTGVEEGATYQWYRNSTEVGTNSPTYTIPSCTKVDAGTYWCKITNPCGESTTNSTGYGIKVWQVLLYSSSWNAYDLTSTGTKTGTLSRRLTPGTYYIKLTHNNGVDFGVNTGETISQITATTPSPWTLYNGQNNIRLVVSNAGDYTFDVNFTSADNPTLSVTYPPSTISGCDKIYFCPTVNSIATGSAKFSIYFFNATENGWANCYLVDGTEYADDAKYVAYAPATTNGWTGMIVVRYSSYISSWDNKWNQSENITYNGYDYIVGRNEWTSDTPAKFKTHLNSFYSSTTPAMSASSYATTVDGTTNASTNLTGATISYASDDPSVATVTSSGVITGVAVGETTITASVGSCTVGTATVTISRNTPTQYTVSGTTAICSGDNTNITLSGSQTGASYQLKKGGVAEGDAKAGTGSSLTWNVSAAGTYTVSAVQTAKYSARDMSGSAVITVNTPVTISWNNAPANGTIGGSMTASVTTNYAAGVTYAVTSASPAGCVTIHETSGAISYVAAGTATITATVTGAGNYCSSANVTQSITVNKNTPTKYSFSVDKTVLCGEETATLTLEDSEDGVTYELREDSSHPIAETQKTGTGSALTWTGLGAGTYVVYAVADATYIERQMDGSKITVSAGMATSITTQPTNQEVTVGEEATLNVVAAGTSLSYQWKESATESGEYSNVASGGTSASYSVTPAAAGTKWYKCVVTGTCGEVTTEARKIVANAAVTYTVTYVYNGADGGSQPASAIGASVSLPNPTKEGYTLQGWYTSSGSLAGAATATYNPTADITLYALWREDECAGGGGGGGSTTTTLSWFDSGTPSSSSGTPKKPDGAGKYYYGYTNSAKTSAYAYTLTTSDGANVGQGEDAEWVNLKYGTSLNVYADNTTTGGTPATFSNVTAISIKIKNKKQTSSFSITIGGTAVATNVSLEGANESTFTEYSYSSLSNLSGKITISNTGSGNSEKHFYIDDISITTAGDDDDTPTCYYVTYNGNGADGGFTKDEASHPSGSDVTVASNSFTKTGHTFNGWNTDPDGEGGTAYAAGGTISDISGNMTLYAQWEEEEDETTYYLVTSTAQLNTTDTYIIANSAGTAVMSTTAADTDKNPDDITSGFSVDGSTLTITSASPNLFKLTSATNGWLFKGGNGSGNYLSSDGTPDADLWYNTSSTPPNNTGEWAVSFAGGIATMKLGKATETTYHIYYDATNTKFIQSTTASNIKIYTSNSTPVYTVTYANGGATSGSVPTDTNSPYEEGATVTVLGNTGSLVKNGYTFAGWNDGSTDYEADDTFTMPAEDVTLTAVWTPNTYDITYNLNGASWADAYSAPATYTVGTGATLPVAGDMTNTGYTFVGWYDNSSLTGSVVTTISTSDYGDKPFWAKWTENTYTITYNANGDGAGNVGDATGSTAATEGHYVTVASCGFELDGYLFTGWNTANNGSGESYGAGEDIELTADMTLYAQWAEDYIITWGNVQIGGAGETVKPNLGGGNYTITANAGSWTGSLDASMISSETSGVSITNVAVNNDGSPKTITVTFAVGAEVVGESIGLTLSVPAAGVYSAKSDTHPIAIDRCTGSGGGSDGVLFSAEFKDSGLGTSNVCSELNTPYTFTTSELKSAAEGGTISAYATGDLNRVKYDNKVVKLTSADGGVIHIHLNNAINTNDLFTYYNTHSSNSNAYLRHTSADNATGQITLTGYGSEKKVMLPAAFNGATELYIVRNSTDFKLHKAAVVRPAFLMLLRDDTPTASSTNLEGNNVELTTENYLTTIKGGNVYYTSPSSGNLKIYRNSSKNYINFNTQAGYLKIVLDEALQEGDVIGFDSYNTNNLALTTTDVRSTSIVTTNQLYTVGSSSSLKGQTTFYIWQNGGSSDYLRGLQIARSGIAGGGGGTDQITTTLSWDPALNTDPDWNSGENRLNKETGDADFTFAAVQNMNSLGALTYSSSNTDVATVTVGGTVHIVGAAGDATITATMAESGCYKGATISYNIHVVDNCDDTPGKVMAYDLGCDGTLLVVVLYDGMDPEAVNYQWYRDGASLGESYRAQRCTVTVAGEYYVVVDNTAAGVGHCAMASENTVVVEARAGISAEKIVDQWYVKNGRRTPDIELVQTTGATGFIVKIGDTPIWNSDGTVTTGFGGCGFHLGENGIIYLNGQADDHSAPDGLSSGDVTLKITAEGCGGNASELSITIHCQASTTRKSIAFVVDGTEKGTFAQPNADHSTNSALYQFLDYTLSGGSGKFDLTAQNIYSSVDEKELREHYSQFDAIIITDDPSTGKTKDGKSYVDAMGALIDVRPILTMEAFVSKLANWKAKGVNGNPESPSPRQYAMTLQCKDHEIFGGLSVGPNVQEEEIDGVDYWTVTMVDKTKSPYSSKASDTDDTEGTPALQGFSASDVSGLLLLGEIKNGDKTMYTGVERQDEPAARLMVLGIQNKALPNALTTEGKTIIENAVEYLLKTNMEEVDDCSNYFIGGGGDNRWETNANWFKGKAPNSPMIRARILAPCEVSTTVHAAHIDIVTSGESSKKGGEMKGQLIIKPNGAVIVGGEVRAAEAPYFNKSDLKPTEEQDLKIETSAEGQGALILNNDAGDTKATVEYFSLGRKDGSVYQFQYFASPMGYLEINPAFAGAGIYTYAWNEAVADGWERRAYYTDVLGFEGLAITTKRDYNSTYTLKGALASTADVDIPLTYTDAGAGGQNLIGNSWTAPINIASLVEAFEDDGNVTKTVNIYNSGNEEYPGLGAAGTWTSVPISVAGWAEWEGLKVIPAMQAFRIDVTSETKLTMNYEKMVRQTESSSLNEPLKAPRRRSNANGASLMRMRLESGNAYTDLFLIEGEQFSEAFDNGYEAKFIAGEDNTVQFYAMNGEEKMAVLATDALEGTQVGFVPGKGTAYTISFSGDGMGYYLNDLKLMTSTLINEEATYSFTFEEGDANRFYISRTPIEAPQTPTGVDNTHSGEVKAQKFIYNGKMYIMINGRVYSADGQIVK